MRITDSVPDNPSAPYFTGDYSRPLDLEVPQGGQGSTGPTSGCNSGSSSTSPRQTGPANPELQYGFDDGMAYGEMLTPNTQTMLRQFLSLPTPVVEQSLDFPNQQTMESTSTQLSVYPYEQPVSAMQGVQAEAVSDPQAPVPMYETPFLLPTGMNLLGPSPLIDPADLQRFLASMDGTAVAYHLGMPLNLMKPEMQISMPDVAEVEAVPISLADDPGLLDHTRLDDSWYSSAEPARKARDPIDVPPFLRDKLLYAYFNNLQRCPSYYVDRDRLYKRLENDTLDPPHPAWLFSMVSR